LDTEFLRRDFSIHYIDELSLAYEKINNLTSQTELSLNAKVIIIVFPRIFPLQAIIANRYILH